uniref:Leucine-rich repeat domain, L domain-like n=1 Tax=Lagenidium giganteum TaxID=4803 RepID=A0AAV2YPW2_9STRA
MLHVRNRAAQSRFILVNFTSFPAAIMQPLPPMLSDIEFSHTNLDSLPTNLHEYWTTVSVLYMEFCHLNEIPTTLTQMEIYDLSLMGNNISNMSLLAEMPPTLSFVSLDFNPTRRLPDSMTLPYSILVIALEYMELEEIPDWLRTNTELALLYGNPYCDENLTDKAVVECVMRDERGDGKVPFECVMQQQPRYLSNPLLTYMVSYIMPPAEARFSTYGAFAAMLGAVHGAALLRLVELSVVAGRLSLNAQGTSQPRWMNSSIMSRIGLWSEQLSRNRVNTVPSSDENCQKLLNRSVNAFSDWLDHRFGIDSPYFREVLVIREALEIIAQAYQAYRCSLLIARNSINTTFIAAVVLNCWSTPFIHALFLSNSAHHALRLRLLCIAADGILNLLTSTILPVVLFVPYYEAYDPEWFTFKNLDNFYDTSWFASFITECQLIFPVTVIDFVSKLIPHISTLVCILTVVPLISRQPKTTSRTIAVRPFGKNPLDLNVGDGAAGRKATKESAQTSKFVAFPSLSKIFVVINVLAVLTGTALLALHIHSRIVISELEQEGCQHKIYPWFPEGFPCMVYDYNCYRHGVDTVSNQALQVLERKSLLWLSFSHCAALVVPPDVRNFPELIGFGLLNVSLVEWSIDAAFSPTTQLHLGSISFTLVNFTNFPAAIMQPLPPMLSDIECSHTNLDSLPTNLHEYWTTVSVLYMEFCHLNEIPTTLTQMEIYDLSLMGNNISNMSLLVEMPPTLSFVSLDFDPTRRLPDSMTLPYSILVIALEYMELEEIPDWLRTNTELALLYGNPYCDENLTDEAVVKCVMRDERGGGKLPFEFVKQQYPL